MVYLALTHGAKGIYYYPYLSIPDDGNTQGLVDVSYNHSTEPYFSKWSEVQTLNSILDSLDATLLQLTSVNVFPGNSPQSFVQSLSDPSDFHIGTFTHSSDPAHYIMIVNRRCAPTDTRGVTVTLNASQLDGTYSYLIKDMYTREAVVTNSSSSPSFTPTLLPGQGKLFRIEPWDSQITLTGDVTVPSGVTLTLQPGTTVAFAANSDDQGSGFDINKSELIVNGTLNAGGTQAQPITFRSTNTTNPSNADWTRIAVLGSATFSYCQIRDGRWGVYASGASSLTVNHGTLTNCGNAGLGLYSTTGTVAYTEVTSSGEGLYLSGSNLTLDHNLIHLNSDEGLHGHTSTATLINNTVANNADEGVYMETGGSATLRNCSITGSGGYGIWNNGSTVNVSYSNLYVNAAGNYYGMSNPIGSNGNISSNAYYNDPYNRDYTLQPHSQLVDAGDPNDPYGNEPSGQGPGRIDIGRFGNTPQATTTPTSSIVNGDFDSAIGRPWDHIFFAAAQGQTWDRVSGTHPGKNGTYYISTCDFVQDNGSGGCHNSPWESETHTGTMRSNRFRITGDYLKFRLAGFNGSSCTGNNNFIRLRRASNDEILFSAKPCGNTLSEVSWSVGSYSDEWVYLELVDGDSGSGYAWIAADYFRQEGAGGGSGLVNGNFEAQMSGWTATGPWAINNTWPLNSGYTQVGLEGSYCAGSHNPENGAGTLTSSPFTLNQTYLNFKVGGWHQYGGQPGFNEVRLVPSGGGSTLR